MIYLFWGFLNIGIFLFFIVTYFRATKLIRESFGLLASIVFVSGLLSFIGKSNDDKDTKEPGLSRIKTWKFISEDSADRYTHFFMDVDLENTLISKYELGIRYGKNKQEKLNIPISGHSWTTGIKSGTKWIPSYIMVNNTDDNTQFGYHVAGIIEWKLLGATIYSQPKEYRGIAKIE
jgi:hypothetical protein